MHNSRLYIQYMIVQQKASKLKEEIQLGSHYILLHEHADSPDKSACKFLHGKKISIVSDHNQPSNLGCELYCPLNVSGYKHAIEKRGLHSKADSPLQDKRATTMEVP